MSAFIPEPEELTLSQAWLQLADCQFEAGDAAGGSLSVWNAVKSAVAALAEERGWPGATDADIGNAVRGFDAETDQRAAYLLRFKPAETLRDNATTGNLDAASIVRNRKRCRDFLENWLPTVALKNPAGESSLMPPGDAEAALAVTEQPAIKKWLERADRQFDSGDDMNGSLSMWRAAKTAIAPLAAKRGWPCETDDDIKDAIRRFDAEYDDRHSVVISFSDVEAFRHNAVIGYLEDYDIPGSRAAACRFLNSWLPRLAAL